ncbi:MAG: zinc ribbon domain-containing protein [Victivallales bacterium]|nr:zinc ribbon domain-containing protein [Victivallales bacterium]
MAENKVYRLIPGVTPKSIACAVELFLQSKKMTTQKVNGANEWLVQGKEEATWKTVTGMSSALTVKITQLGEDSVNVEVGNGKWADKLGAGAAGMILFAPLAFTAAWGAWKQKSLLKEVLARIDAHILAQGNDIPKDEEEVKQENAVAAAKASGKVICPGCGCVNEKGTKFCENCGEKLSISCPQCGAPLPIGKKFCSECGASLGGPAKCPNCGSEIPEGKKFCAECGAKIG